MRTNIQGGAKGGLQLFIWKIMQSLINNNTKIYYVSHAHNCKPTFAPPCIYVTYLTTEICMFKYNCVKILTLCQ